ncbi:MAG: hypothetical protein JST00_34215 [Deltaproteobacteria bacterium]|nr:hypothetical protein [Deltaproteobacteria bacterium]
MSQWSNPPPPYGGGQGGPGGYPSQYPPPYPPQGQMPPGMPSMPPPGPEKKGFKFQMWMLGALIVPIGIGIAVRDIVKKGSIELGGECSDSEHCKSGTCLTGDVGQCTKTCSKLDPCPTGFSCQPVNVTLHNQGGFHNLGTQTYCIKGKGGDPAAGASSSPSDAASASTSAAAPTPSTTASAAPAETATASATASAAASAPPAKPGTKPKTKPKGKK